MARIIHQVLAVALIAGFGPLNLPQRGREIDNISIQDLTEWLSYIASDDLDGRATYSEGAGLAAAYIASQLRSWNIKPGGDAGSYFQRVPVLGVNASSRST